MYVQVMISFKDTRGIFTYIMEKTYDISFYSNSSSLPLSERIVVFLAKNLLDEGRHIIVNNWYLSTCLAQYFLQYNTYITGTMHTNRGVPQHLTDKIRTKNRPYLFEMRICY